RCTRRSPTRATRACGAAPLPSLHPRPLRSFLPAFVLLVLVVVVVVVFLVLAFLAALDFVLRLVFVLVVVVGGGDIELDRREADDFEARATLGTTELIALVDVEFVDLDLGVAFRTGGHHRLRSLRIPAGGSDREDSGN